MKKLNTRILSVILAFSIIMTNYPLVTSANEGFSISCDGNEVTHVEFYENEKLEISADNLLEGASCQWQIQIPGTDTWINIHGQTGETLKLTYALLGSLLDNENSANVRCAAMSDGEAVAYTEKVVATVQERPTITQERVSEFFSVPSEPNIKEEVIEEEIIEEEIIEEEIVEEEIIEEEIIEEEVIEEEIVEEETIEEEIIEEEQKDEDVSVGVEQIDEIEPTELEPVAYMMPRKTNLVSVSENPPAIEENTQIVSVTIEYYYEDRDGNQGNMVMDPYVAKIPKGAPLNVSVPCKIFPGYEIVLHDSIDGVSLVDNEISVALNNVSENQTIVVHYKEIQVPYYARYFMQNVYNDMYTERADILTEEQKDKMLGFAGEQPNEKLVYPNIVGFSPLFYQPDKIAADGSTVFEVYFDRNYYLINFDLDGGFGTVPMYARYETAFAVSNPVKPGYEFDGWELTSYDTKTDGTDEENAAYNAELQKFLNNAQTDSNGLIKKIPYTNMTYTAKWKPLETTYTVAYWLRKGTGNDTTELFLGNRIAAANSNATVSGQDDLQSDMPICGLGMHEHTDECYSIPTHVHSNDCVDVTKLSNDYTENNHRDISAIKDIGTPESGYLYTIHVENYSDTATYYKLYLNGQWYSVDSSYLSGVSLGEGRYDTGEYDNGNSKTAVWVANKYYAKLPCGYGSSTLCGNHDHNTSCYQNTRHLEFVGADQNVTVKGDGSTVVNVYYEYKQYTLKFYYAATTGGTDKDNNGMIDADEYESVKIVGGSTYHFGTYGYDSDDDKTLLQNMYSQTNQWGEVDELPQLNAEGLKRNYEKGTLVVNKDATNTSEDITYHYISFKAYYGDDISEMWPCDVFESVTRINKNTNDPSNGWSGTEAFVSAWNGEYRVKYSQDYSGNQTIKGIYEELDEKLLFHPKYDDSQEVSYLCFWENGAEIKWNAPELYIYNIWLPFQGTDDEFERLPEAERRINPNNQKKYWLYRRFNTCDDSIIKDQTGIAITGYEEDLGFRAWSTYFISQAKYGQINTNDSACFYVVSNYDEKKYQRPEELGATIGRVYSGNYSYDVNMTVRDYTNIDTIVETPNGSGTYLLHTDKYDPENPSGVINHTLYREAYDVDFYYRCNEHRIYYRNYNKNMGSGEGAIVSYGKALGVYGAYYTKQSMEENHYPDVLEPDAYEFAGWYTSAECLEGTEMDWSGKMPDSDVTVYAKWVPKTYTVKFYLDYDRLQAGNDVWYKKTDASHGETMKNLDQTKILPTGQYVDANGNRKNYKFVGWFYINEEGKKEAFNPAEMEVRENLELYAEWSSTTVKEYTIHYKLGKLSDDQKTIIPINEGENGYRVLGESAKGYAFEATTKTFGAKPEEQLNNLTAEEKGQYIWVPHTNSHSILMKENNADNVFTFWYVAQSNIPYTVRYLDAATNEPIVFREDGSEYQKNVDSNTNSVVTEQFVYVPGYIPDAFHKTLVLSFNPNENVIVFYYTKDENYKEDGDDEGEDPDQQSARYLVTHYVQDVDAETYSVYTTDDLIGIVGENVSAEALDIAGFSFDEGKTKKEMGNNAVENEGDKWCVKGMVTTGETASALQLKLYYSRNKYSYIVKYLNADDLKTPVHEEKKTEKNYSFGSVVTENALEDIKGYDLYGSKTQTLKISSIETMNVITFLYMPKSFTVNYVPVCRNQDLTGGYVLTTAEYGNTIVGTPAVAYDGFEFMGWYSDKECTKQVGSNEFYKPNVSANEGVYEYTFYALFEPNTLTITQTNMQKQTDTGIYEIVNSSNQVIATVMITGNSSVTLGQVPVGTYSIREISGDWTWTYGGTEGKSFTVVGGSNNHVTFEQTGRTVDWLHSEDR